MTADSGQPYLSVVTCSRNDDHGRGMFKRMQASLASLVAQLERYELVSELVLVDYNPPADNPLLKDVLEWPERTRFCTIRTVVVPPEAHRRFKDSERIQYYGALAQNVGIRRAKGRFVLSTNADILFPDELVEKLSRCNLEEGKLYRVDRHDVAREAAEIESLDDRLKFCREHPTLFYTRYGAVPFVGKKRRIASRNLDFSKYRPDRGKMPKLHILGGDFTLMSSGDWHTVRGWPEIDVLSLGAETVLYGSAYLNGIKEEILPAPLCVYHIEHDSRWRKTRRIYPAVRKACFRCLPDRVALALIGVPRRACLAVAEIAGRRGASGGVEGIDWIGFEGLHRIVREMQDGTRPETYNGGRWGLGDENLEEYTICAAHSRNPIEDAAYAQALTEA